MGIKISTIVPAVIASSVAMAAQNAPSLKQQLESELQNQSFQTKVILRSMLSEPRQPGMWNYVDTNLFLDGRVLFSLSGLYMIDRGGPMPKSSTCGPNSGNGWTGPGVSRSGTLCWLDPNSAVLVTQIGLARDQLALGYWPSGQRVDSSPPAILRLMLGPDWQKTMSFDQVMDVVADTLVIPRVERVRVVAADYLSLQQQSRLSEPSGTDPSDRRLEQTQRLREILIQLIANRREHTQLGRASSEQEVVGYTSRLLELETEIARLQEEVKRGRIQAIGADMSTSESEARRIKSDLSRTPTTEAELKRAEELLLRWEENLRRRGTLGQQLSDLDTNVAVPRVVSELRSEQDEIRTNRANLAALAPKIELMSLNSSFLQMKSAETRLKAAYVHAFGTFRQQSAGAQFRDHLQSMIANRERARQLGATSTPEIQRLQGQLVGIR